MSDEHDEKGPVGALVWTWTVPNALPEWSSALPLVALLSETRYGSPGFKVW